MRFFNRPGKPPPPQPPPFDHRVVDPELQRAFDAAPLHPSTRSALLDPTELLACQRYSGHIRAQLVNAIMLVVVCRVPFSKLPDFLKRHWKQLYGDTYSDFSGSQDWQRLDRLVSVLKSQLASIAWYLEPPAAEPPPKKPPPRKPPPPPQQATAPPPPASSRSQRLAEEQLREALIARGRSPAEADQLIKRARGTR